MSVEDRTRAALLAAATSIDPDTDSMLAGVEATIHRHQVRRRALLGVAAAAVAVGVAAGSSVLRPWQGEQDTAPAGSPGSEVTTTVPRDNPAAVIEAYQSAYNTGDIDAVMALFAEDATITDHPLADQAAVGLDAIRDLHEVDMGEAAASEAYEVANIDSDGDTVTWDHTWTNSNGQQWCAQGNTALIADGTIISWAFAPNPELCI